MNRKLTFLTVLMVIVAIFAVTSMVLADELLPVNITAEEVYVGSADTVLSVEAPEEATIQWFKEVYGSGVTAQPIAGATAADYTLTADDTAKVGLNLFYATVNGAKSELIKITVVKAPYVYTKDPAIFRFDSETKMNDHTGSAANSEKSIATLDDCKKVLMVKHTTGSNDVNVYFTNLAVPVADYKIAVYKVMPMIEGSRSVVLYPTYDDKNGAYNPGSGYFQKNLGYTGANGQWQYIVDEDIKHLDGGVMSDGFPNGPVLFNGGRFDYYNDSPGVGSVMYIESVMFFATQQDCDEYIAKDSANNVPEQPDNLDMVAWEFKNDPAFAATFLPDTDVTDGANLKAGVKTTTSLMSRNKFDLDMYSVVKVLGADEGTVTFFDGETELGKINLAEGNVANFSNKADFPNWKGEFTNLKIEASQDMTVTAIAFFVSEENAKLYTAKAYFCDECGQAPCVCPTKPLKYEDAIWWNFADTWTTDNMSPVNASVDYVGVTDEDIAHGKYTAKADGEIKLEYNEVNMKAAHKLDTAEYPFIKIGYKYSGAAPAKAYIKFTTDRSAATVNFDLVKTDVDNKGYDVISLDFSSLTSLQAIDDAVTDEFRGALDKFEFGIVDAKAGDVLDMAYILFFKDDGQANEFKGEQKLPPQTFIPASWAVKDTIKNEYVTLADLDMTADNIEFKIEDYSRISRITLNELKKYHANKVISILGNGYKYQFNTSHVKPELKTWYYDLDAYFAAGFSGDVYRETIKELITEGEYIVGVHFVHKFVKNTDFPFVGKLILDMPEELEGKYLDVYKYDPRTNTVAITERAPVKEGKVSIGTLGGDIAIVNSGYQPTAEEIARAEAYETYENTAWDVKLYDFGADADSKLTYKANNAIVETLTENGVTFKRATSASTTRIESVFTFTETFEASEYPVMVIKYKTSGNYSTSAANYVSTDFYTADTTRGYTWLGGYSYYSTGSIFEKSTGWKTRVINYTNLESMKASGLGVSEEWNEAPGSKRSGGQAFPFKGNMVAYRLDFSTGAAGVSVDMAYIAFFKTEEEARKYVEARTKIEEYENAEAKAAEEAAKGPKPAYIVFDFLDKNETAKFTLHPGSDSFPVKTETKNTAEGFWSKDADGEYNLTRSLSDDEQFSLKDYPVLKIKAKPSMSGVNSQFYVWQDNQSGNPRVDFPFATANEWNELILDYSSASMASGTWDGTLTKFRFDPMRTAKEREIIIEYIGFFESVEAAEAFTSVADAKAAEKAAAKKK